MNNRVDKITGNLEQFLWLYNVLGDYRSKSTLLAILSNWTDFNITMLNQIKEYSPCYFDPDLIQKGEEEVFVDIGAYTGDTVQEFVSAYGESYKRLYCYEVTPTSIQILKENVADYKNVIIRQKGVGKEKGETVTIDEDIKEPVTFIKMNIEGAEQNALTGCRETIKKYHPKLAISTYHNYEDIWKIPKMIHEIDSSYKFYMRYYGGNLIPTEFVLYAL